MATDIDQSHYNTGTATVAANGTAVTGIGTTWAGAVRKGDLFGAHKGDGIRILSVDSNTALTLAYPWPGGAQTAAAYEIQRTPYDVGYLQAIEDMIRLYGEGNLPSLAALDGTGGDLVPMFTGSGAVTLVPRSSFLSGGQPSGRLSLASGQPVTASDMAAATSIYYVPCLGNLIPICNGTSVAYYYFSQLSLNLDADVSHLNYHAAGNYDVFIINHNGVLRLATGPIWNAGATPGNGRLRGIGSGSTELETIYGLNLNKNSMVARYGNGISDTVAVPARTATYIGSFRATAAGVATDTMRQRLLFNAYNPTLRPMFRGESVTSWNYSTLTWRQANANALNQLDVLLGLAGTSVDIEVKALVKSSAATVRTVHSGIGLNLTTNFVAGSCADIIDTDTRRVQTGAKYIGIPSSIGFNSFTWLEIGDGNDTQTWYGAGVYFQCGIAGQVIM